MSASESEKNGKKPRTAVTHKDYEACVLNTPGLMIESEGYSANQIRKWGHAASDMTMSIVVKPFRPKRAEE